MAAILSSWKENEDGEDAIVNSAGSPHAARPLPGLASGTRANQSIEDVEEAEARAIDAEIDLGERLLAEAWNAVRNVSLPRGFERSGPTLSVAQRFRQLADSVGAVEWYCFAMAIIVMICLDVLILQHLPEMERANFGLLVLWLFISVSYCIGVCLRLGLQTGVSWASGYLLEMIFSLEHMFIFNLIFHTLETPLRLVRKALFAVLIGSVLLRLAFQLGLAEVMCKLTCLPYILGGWLVYCGSCQVSRENSTTRMAKLCS
jgi:hypothetical protein